MCVMLAARTLASKRQVFCSATDPGVSHCGRRACARDEIHNSSPADARAVARLVEIVQRDNADTDEQRARNASQSGRAGSTVAHGCVLGGSSSAASEALTVAPPSPVVKAREVVPVLVEL
jgi:hypothetical protein